MLEGLTLTKAHGAGNDFILIPDFDGRLRLDAQTVAALCDRHRGVGADGVIRVVRARAREGAPAVDARVGPQRLIGYSNAPGGRGDEAPLLPAGATHIARDLLDPHLDEAGVVGRMRSSRRAVKTLLLDQGIVSGIGNIYADEGLWAARVHGLRRGEELGPRVTARILRETAGVMRRALEVGGTSFDSLYVDVEGAAGFFARQLAVYGRAGLPCRRCGAPLRSEVIGGRSHAFCPRCQTRPRSRP